MSDIKNEIYGTWQGQFNDQVKNDSLTLKSVTSQINLENTRRDNNFLNKFGDPSIWGSPITTNMGGWTTKINDGDINEFITNYNYTKKMDNILFGLESNNRSTDVGTNYFREMKADGKAVRCIETPISKCQQTYSCNSYSSSSVTTMTSSNNTGECNSSNTSSCVSSISQLNNSENSNIKYCIDYNSYPSGSCSTSAGSVSSKSKYMYIRII